MMKQFCIGDLPQCIVRHWKRRRAGAFEFNRKPIDVCGSKDQFMRDLYGYLLRSAWPRADIFSLSGFVRSRYCARLAPVYVSV